MTDKFDKDAFSEEQIQAMSEDFSKAYKEMKQKEEGNTQSAIKTNNWLEKIPVPEGGGLLQRLAEKDKALSEFYDLQDPFRRGFMLAEEIVKKWAEETCPLKK